MDSGQLLGSLLLLRIIRVDGTSINVPAELIVMTTDSSDPNLSTPSPCPPLFRVKGQFDSVFAWTCANELIMALDIVTASGYSCHSTLLYAPELRSIGDELHEDYCHLSIRYVQPGKSSMLNAFKLTGVIIVPAQVRQTASPPPQHTSRSPHGCAPLPPNKKPAWHRRPTVYSGEA